MQVLITKNESLNKNKYESHLNIHLQNSNNSVATLEEFLFSTGICASLFLSDSGFASTYCISTTFICTPRLLEYDKKIMWKILAWRVDKSKEQSNELFLLLFI